MCFDCKDISKESQCKQLEGCFWDSDSCEGNFSPTCSTSKCYYIDTSATTTTKSGTPKNPFTSLSEGFSITGNRELIIINHNEEVIFQPTSTIIVDSTIVVRPLFQGIKYYIDFSKLPTPLDPIFDYFYGSYFFWMV